jgi:hypothetical protein
VAGRLAVGYRAAMTSPGTPPVPSLLAGLLLILPR